MKIKIERPDEEAAAQIFTRYLESDLPLAADEVAGLGGGDPAKAVQAMIEQTVEVMYRADDANRFLEVTYQNGDKEVMYFKDFASGAMIENIVRRAKKLAIKRLIAGGDPGIGTADLLASIAQEYKEHEDLPNTTNPDDWAKISGRRASASSTSAPWCRTEPKRGPAVARSNGWPPVSTSEAFDSRVRLLGPRAGRAPGTGSWPRLSPCRG